MAKDQSEGKSVVKKEWSPVTFLLPFLLGAAVGVFGGAIIGTVIAPYVASARSVAGKAFHRRDSDQPKFELLLQ